jgi:lysophospholipase L1-like esterase
VPTPTDPLYAALGDSTGVGVGARDGRGFVVRLHERMCDEQPQLRLLNLCVSGATSQGVVSWQLPRAMAVAPSIVTVFMGINDLLQGVAPESFAENVERVAQGFAERRTPTLFCTLPDLAFAPAARRYLTSWGSHGALLEARTQAFNELIERYARAHGHAVHDLFDVALADGLHFFSSDGFHPSSEGYEELARRLWPDVRALIGTRA